MRIDIPDIKVFVSSRTKENPYHAGDAECLQDSGLYCERVFRTRKKLLVKNALENKEWCNNPDIKLGMISYLGLPIFWPDQGVFGTICVLDKKENSYKKENEEVLLAAKRYVEAYLDILMIKYLVKDKHINAEKGKNELKQKEKKYNNILAQIDSLLHKF